MALEIVHGQPHNVEAARQLADLVEDFLDDGTIYLGYPVLAMGDDRVEIDALLVACPDDRARGGRSPFACSVSQ